MQKKKEEDQKSDKTGYSRESLVKKKFLGKSNCHLLA